MIPLGGMHILKSDSKLKKKKSKQNRKPESPISSDNFPIVGVGASAGGLEAFIQMFSKMPVNTGMAFVLVQHLDPTHPSMSADIIARATQLKVEEVRDGMRIEPNHVYIIPPNYNMGIQKGILNLSAREMISGQNMTIDHFFQSLARSEKAKAIGILLSGTGRDGTTGLWAIKAEGGITYAQDPSSAKYPEMPEHAVAAGVVDLILKPEDIAGELSKILAHPYIASGRFESTEQLIEEEYAPNVSNTTAHDSPTSDTLNKLFALLRTHKRVDFSGYKKTTIIRRIQRRMIVQKTKSFADYVNYLEAHEEEAHDLYNDILINVTDFFRDPDSFKALAKHVFPSLLKNKPKGNTIRIWVPGCSTGEEVYSIAIYLLEFLSKSKRQNSFQIFATDISEHAIQKARTGQYSESVVRGLSKEQLKHYFERIEGGYQINKTVRELCLFSRHDVTSDPPFAKLDFISCRNVMIYFDKFLQKRIIPIFHYALSPGRFLWLGRSENLGEFSQLFNSIEKAHKIYSKSNMPTPVIHFSTKHLQNLSRTNILVPITKNGGEFQKVADKILLSRFSPPGVIVNTDFEILQFRGRTVPFLEPATGQPSLNLLKMARPELLASIRTTIQAVKKEDKSIDRPGLHFEVDGRRITLDLEVIPIHPKAPAKEKTFLVLFKETKAVESVRMSARVKGKKDGQLEEKQMGNEKRIQGLMTELSELRDYQQSLIEQYEITQEELTTANEELQSTNEELQSTNEEIETAKEELQSTNEELVTVNEELQMRNVDLTTLSSDLNNLLISIEIPVLIVGSDHRVRRFSPKAKSAFNLIASDISRPISDVKPNFDLNLTHLISEVGEALSPKQIEVQTFDGGWLRLQIRPYKTIDNRIDGAIISLTDIDELKKREKRTTEAYVQADKANFAKDVFLATLSHELRTPLSSILTWAQLIAQGKVDFEQAKQGAAVIEQNAKAQNQLIDDLLDISRIIVGKLALNIKSVAPVPVIQAAIESVRPMAEKKSIKIEFDLPSAAGIIRADPTRLQQIFWNLLTNAIKFSPKMSTITIELKYVEEQNKQFAKIKVADRGKGIPPEFLSQIFNRFSQADSTSTRIHGGLGLGLSIVQSLVESQSGTVKAENANDGKGAAFTVTFPVISHQTAIIKSDLRNGGDPISDDDNETRQSPKLDGLRILIVDDDESTREAIGIYLKSFGAQIMTAESANEGLEIFSRFRPGILLSDIAMPGKDGYSLIRKIRSLDSESGGDIPALALSAYTSEDDTKNALAAGFQAHVTKPVEADALARFILKMMVKNGGLQ